MAVSSTGQAQQESDSLDPYAHETQEQRDVRMAWFREAKFGLFIHWGVYAVPAGTYKGEQISGIGEWILNRGKIPMAQYRAIAKQFNPVKHDRVALPAQKSIINTAYDADQMSIVNWGHVKSSVDWDFKINTPGTYRVTLLAACEKDSRIRISVAKKYQKPTVPATGGFEDFQSFEAGTIEIDKAGDVTIHLQPVRKEWAPIKFRTVEFTLKEEC